MSKASKPCEGVEPGSRPTRWTTRRQAPLLQAGQSEHVLSSVDWANIPPPQFHLLQDLEDLYIPEHVVRPRIDDQMDALSYALNLASWAEALRGEG